MLGISSDYAVESCRAYGANATIERLDQRQVRRNAHTRDRGDRRSCTRWMICTDYIHDASHEGTQEHTSSGKHRSTHAHTHTEAHTHTLTQTQKHTCTHTHRSTHTHTHSRKHRSTHAHTHTHANTCTHMHTHAHTCTHSHTQTHSQCAEYYELSLLIQLLNFYEKLSVDQSKTSVTNVNVSLF